MPEILLNTKDIPFTGLPTQGMRYAQKQQLSKGMYYIHIQNANAWKITLNII